MSADKFAGAYNRPVFAHRTGSGHKMYSTRKDCHRPFLFSPPDQTVTEKISNTFTPDQTVTGRTYPYTGQGRHRGNNEFSPDADYHRLYCNGADHQRPNIYFCYQTEHRFRNAVCCT